MDKAPYPPYPICLLVGLISTIILAGGVYPISNICYQYVVNGRKN